MILSPITSSLFGSFQGGFIIWLLSFSLVYGLLSKKMDKKDMAALIAFSVALLIGTTIYMVNILMFAIPIIVGVIIFAFFFLLIGSMMYGDMEASIPLKLKRTMVLAAIIIVAFFIFWVLQPQFMDSIGTQIQTGLNEYNTAIPINSTSSNFSNATVLGCIIGNGTKICTSGAP